MSENNNYPERYNKLDEMFKDFEKVYENTMNNVSDGLYKLKGRTNRQMAELADYVDEEHYILKDSKTLDGGFNDYTYYTIEQLEEKNNTVSFEEKKELILDQLIITEAVNTYLKKNSKEELFTKDENRHNAKKILLDIRPKLKDEFDKKVGRPVKNKKKEMSDTDILNQTLVIKNIIRDLNPSWTEDNLNAKNRKIAFNYTGKSNKELIINVLENEIIRLETPKQIATESQDNAISENSDCKPLIGKERERYSNKEYLDAWTKTKNFVKKIKPDMLSIQNRFNRHKGYNSLKS